MALNRTMPEREDAVGAPLAAAATPADPAVDAESAASRLPSISKKQTNKTKNVYITNNKANERFSLLFFMLTR